MMEHFMKRVGALFLQIIITSIPAVHVLYTSWNKYLEFLNILQKYLFYFKIMGAEEAGVPESWYTLQNSSELMLNIHFFAFIKSHKLLVWLVAIS